MLTSALCPTRAVKDTVSTCWEVSSASVPLDSESVVTADVKASHHTQSLLLYTLMFVSVCPSVTLSWKSRAGGRLSP